MAVYTAVATGGNWNAAATWGGAGFPIAGDTANITAVMTATVTVNVASACAILNLTGNGGTLAFGNFVITCTGNVTLGGTITAGTGGLAVSSTSTMAGAGVTFPGTLLLSGLGTTKTLSGNWINTGLTTFNTNITLNKTAAETMKLNGGISFSSNITGTAKIIFGGGNLGGTGYLVNDCEFAGNSTFNGFKYGVGTMTYTSGTIAGAGVLTINGATVNLDLDRGATKFTVPEIAVLVTSTITLLSNLTIGGTFSPSTASAGSTCTFAGNYNITCATLFFGGSVANRYLVLVQSRTMTVTTAIEINGYTVGITRGISSTGAGTPTLLNYTGLASACKIFVATFTDVNASGSSQVIDNWYGVNGGGNTNVTVRTSADIGGGASSNVFGWI